MPRYERSWHSLLKSGMVILLTHPVDLVFKIYNMGEIADGLIDGTFDSITGEYLGEGPGYPRTQYRDKKETSNAAKERGITKWLQSNGFTKNHGTLLKTFLEEQQPHLNMNRYSSVRQMKVHISRHCFGKFVFWCKNINKGKCMHTNSESC